MSARAASFARHSLSSAARGGSRQSFALPATALRHRPQCAPAPTCNSTSVSSRMLCRRCLNSRVGSWDRTPDVAAPAGGGPRRAGFLQSKLGAGPGAPAALIPGARPGAMNLRQKLLASAAAMQLALGPIDDLRGSRSHRTGAGRGRLICVGHLTGECCRRSVAVPTDQWHSSNLT